MLTDPFIVGSALSRLGSFHLFQTVDLVVVVVPLLIPAMKL